MELHKYLENELHASRIHSSDDITLYNDNGIAWLVFNMKQRPVNVINITLLSQFNDVLRHVQSLIQSKSIYAVIFTSSKPNSFIAGADITSMYPNVDLKAAEESSRTLQSILSRIEILPIPTVAAINGTALGAGLELALACTYRVSSDNEKIQIGLPEVKLGLIPGAGGTVRLPALIGLQESLQILLPGGSVRPKKAKSIGLVDELLPSADRVPNENRFFSSVRQYASKVIGKSPSRQLIDRSSTGSLKNRILDGTSYGNQLIAYLAARGLDQKTKGKYPAPYFALDSAVNSLSVSKKDALDVESTYFGKLAVSPQSKALMALFVLTEERKKRSEKFQNVQPLKLKKIGVIGAGVMGAQIACLFATKNLQVYLRDINTKIVESGLAHIQQYFMDRAKKGKLKQEEAMKRISLVSGGTDIKGFQDCDLLLEAAVENLDLKKKIVKECETIIRPDCIFATNTSSLSINALASASLRPQNVIGFHFFNPVARMPLIEIISNSKTNSEVIATAYQLALDIGKIPIVCKDGPGFVVNRILGAYMNEAAHLALEGKSISEIDGALLKFGMPMGPFRLMDEVGLDVVAHVGPILESGLGERFKTLSPYRQLLLDHPGMLGKKTGAGFYTYSDDGKTISLNGHMLEELTVLVSRTSSDAKKTKEAAPKQASDSEAEVIPSIPPVKGIRDREKEIVDRCVLLMINEAAYILSENLVAAPAEIDVAMVFGTGFAPFTGGLLSFADSFGIKSIVDRLFILSRSVGKRFQPHPFLLDMADRNARFFPNRPPPGKLQPITTLPRSRL